MYLGTMRASISFKKLNINILNNLSVNSYNQFINIFN